RSLISSSYRALRLLRSFPTRRSSDLMVPATLNTVSVDLAAGSEHNFRASGTTVVFPGFLAVYEEGKDTKGAEDEDEGRKLPLMRSEEHTTELQSRFELVCRLLLAKKK